MIEIIESDHPKASSPEMQKAMLDEISDLIKRGPFQVNLSEELPDGANCFMARFVLAIKSQADGFIRYKPRYVIGSILTF